MGGSGLKSDTAHAVTIDADDNIYVAGEFQDPTLSMFLRKYDADGNEIWTESVTNMRARAVDVRGDALVVSGFHSVAQEGQNYFVRHYGLDQSFDWQGSENIGALDDYSRGVAIADNMQVFVAGYYEGNPNLLGFVRKHNADGGEAWTQIIDMGDGNEFMNGIDTTSDNGAVVVGSMSDGGIAAVIRKYTSGGGVDWTQTAPQRAAHGVAVDAADSLAVAGIQLSNPRKVWVRRMSPEGETYWNDADGNADNVVAFGVTFDVDGNLIVVASRDIGDYELWIRKYRP